MENPLVSVVIPFYGVEKYIEECILSVKNQSFTNFECILVDDESPDNSFQIAKKTIGNDQRFYIIRQKNTRQGGARNNGINHAKGKYITFLDSDDFFAPSFLEEMIKVCEKTGADMVKCGIVHFNDFSGEEVTHRYTSKYKIITNKKQIRNHLFRYPGVIAFYKKEVFETARFPENVFMEDFAIVPQIMEKVTTLCMLSQRLYYYRLREGSVTNVFKMSVVEDRFQVFNQYILPYLKRVNTEKDFITQMYIYHMIIPINLSVFRYFKGSFSEKVTLLKNIRKRFDSDYFNFLDIVRQFQFRYEFLKTIFVLFHWFSVTLSTLFLKLKR